MTVRVGDRFRSSDPRRPSRDGVVVKLSRGRATLKWDSGGKSAISLETLEHGGEGNRSYVRLPRRAQTTPPADAPSPKTSRRSYSPPRADRQLTVEASRRQGVWLCAACPRSSRSLKGWMQVVFPQGRWLTTECAIVCSEKCLADVEETVARRRAPILLEKLGDNMEALRAFARRPGEPAPLLRGQGLVVHAKGGWRLTRLGRRVLKLDREARKQEANKR